MPDSSASLFVGRHRELAELLGAARRAPAVVLVEGEAGIGKSRLVREAGAVLAEEGRQVLVGHCHPLREPFLFGPVADALRAAESALPPPERMGPAAGALGRLLPELADRLPTPPPPDELRGERYQLARAVREVLQALGPVVLVVEDVHWSDDATRELLLLLSRDPPPELSLVLTYRAEDLAAGAPVLGAAYRHPAGVTGAELHLGPLTESDVHELAARMLGVEAATGQLCRALYERSDGLPLVVEEDVRALESRVSPTADLGGELDRIRIPRAFQEAIAARLAVLPPEATAVVHAAAVLAVPASQALLGQVADLAEEPVEAGLVGALEAAVLREARPGEYDFRHALAQQAIYEGIVGPRRRRLHLRAIDALRRQSPPALVQIAHHTLALGDRQAWLLEAQAAADHANAAGDYGVAAGLLRKLLAEPTLPADRRSEAALALSRFAEHAVDFTGTIPALRSIVADPDLDTVTRGEIRLALGLAMANQANLVAGFEQLELAIDELAERPELASRAMAALAVRNSDVPMSENLAWMERAERAVEGSTRPAARLAVQASKVTVLSVVGDPAAWPLVDALPRHGTDAAGLRQSARGLYNAADSAIWLGHDERARSLLDESEELAVRWRHPVIAFWCRLARLRLDWTGGHWRGLDGRIGALAAELADMPTAHAYPLLLTGLLATARGEWALAQERLDAVAALARTHQMTMWRVASAAGLGRVRLARGESAAAWEVALDAIGALRRKQVWVWGVGLYAVAVDAALHCGLPQEAEQLVDEVEAGISGRDAPAVAAEMDLCRGLLLEANDPPSARARFERSRQRYADLGRPYIAAYAAELAARALAPADQRAAAQELTRTAAEFARLGATADEARCQRALRELGLAPPSPVGRRGYGDELSPREVQVARLLTRGASNREIAQALFLSPRTVEHHVAHALRKLGVSREQAAGAARALPENGGGAGAGTTYGSPTDPR